MSGHGGAGPPIVCFVSSRSGTGKTTLLEKVIAEMTSRGYAVGTIKSDSHGVQMDREGKDTWRFARAGARVTAIIGPDSYALIQKTPAKENLETVAAMLRDVDIILVEGYKDARRPKIEVVRAEKGAKIITDARDLAAVAGDIADFPDLPGSVRIFDLDDYRGVADFIIETYLPRKGRASGDER
ncbi:MAG: molybdopterin-guanine dinucleotide biosynthesis protein B [Synergistaceae bacterium]|nr:molybdopterin-guanine dinucleotide biosynthesis protein B [Synergistaceae bacterium]